MPIYFRENQFNGPNPILQSYFQNTYGTWEKFHLNFVVSLSRAINLALPAGYYCICPESPLQMREKFEFGEPEYMRCLMVGTPDSGKPLLLDPIVHLELISHTSKPAKISRTPDEDEQPLLNHHVYYVQHRDAIPQSGTILMELDLLHEQRPTVDPVPSYKDRAPDSTPYNMLVTNPHGKTENEQIYAVGMGVDEPMPLLQIPLRDGGLVEIDLNYVYNRTFLSRPQYGEAITDYEQKPTHFETYHKPDQEKILAKLEQITAAVH